MSHNPLVWIAAILTFCIFSFLYKDNPFYRAAEHIFVGVSAAWLFATYVHADIIDDMLLKAFPSWFHQTTTPDYWPLGGGIVGLFILLRLWPTLTGISRYGIAFVVGSQTGLQLPSAVSAYVLAQIRAVLLPLFVPKHWGETIRNWFMSFGTFTGLSYFYFSKEHRGIFGILTRIGIWVLMISFGAAYGATVMTRMSILLGRIYFLLSTWLGLVH
jgi:hypothetical protein